MDEQTLLKRTKQFALRVLRLAAALPKTELVRPIAVQPVKAGTSVGANYRAACRARSSAEFTAKIGIVEEEADESAFWLELIIEGQVLPARRVADLLDEANQLTAIMSASHQTARRRSAPSTDRRRTIAKRKSQIANP